MSQIQEMIKPAAAMLDTYPVVITKQKIKQWIKTCVPGMTPEKVERYSWPQALLAMGLLQAYEQTKDKTALSSVFSYLRRWKNSGYPISHVDHVMNGSVALWTEEILTREKGKMQNLWKRSGSAGKGRTFAQAGSKQRKNCGRHPCVPEPASGLAVCRYPWDALSLCLSLRCSETG